MAILALSVSSLMHGYQFAPCALLLICNLKYTDTNLQIFKEEDYIVFFISLHKFQKASFPYLQSYK